jgi:cysteine synthase B
MLGAALGFPVTLCMPSNVSPERKKHPRAYGAEVVWTDPADGSDGAIRKARELVAAEPDRYFYADQYGNEQNWKAHYRTTANEIWEQTEGQVTHFVAGLGTSGTFMGTTRRLRELNPAIQCISMQPDSPFNGLEGLKHMATAIVPPIYDPTLADANIEMETERAYAMAKRAGAQPACWSASRPPARSPRRCRSPSRRPRRTRGRDRHHPLRLRGQVPQRTLLAGGQ